MLVSTFVSLCVWYFILILKLSAGLSRLSRLGTFPLSFQVCISFTHVPDLCIPSLFIFDGVEQFVNCL